MAIIIFTRAVSLIAKASCASSRKKNEEWSWIMRSDSLFCVCAHQGGWLVAQVVRLGEDLPRSFMALVSGHLSDNVYSGLGEAFWTSFPPSWYVQFALTPSYRALLPGEDLLALSELSVTATQYLRLVFLVSSKLACLPVSPRFSVPQPVTPKTDKGLPSFEDPEEERGRKGPLAKMRVWLNWKHATLS